MVLNNLMAVKKKNNFIIEFGGRLWMTTSYLSETNDNVKFEEHD